MSILETINSPKDLKKLSEDQMIPLCREIREFLFQHVTKTGGHLASNLGVTELTVAIHRIFSAPDDHIIFDVGHQSYVHKILTGRRDRFDDLRVPGGLSGFTSRRESEYDAFGAGHSSTSLSAGLGFAEADALAERQNHTVVVVGDGAYTGGMIHEALNNCKPNLRLVVILNENRMSISMNRGLFASYLSRVRISGGYNKIKHGTKKFFSKIPWLGAPLERFFTVIHHAVKRVLYPMNYFEQLGFYYIGPVDGNDYKAISRALERARLLGKSVIVHAKTKKGKGYSPAERSPQKFHSVYGKEEGAQTFHGLFAERLISMADRSPDVVAVTAAMGIGTGLEHFGEKYPKRYFDVGIAEPHALTFCAGLAAAGLKPYAVMYSTFLQRAYDNVLHDIALQNLPVRMIIDRAGLAVSDGATHHGIFDVAFLSQIPGIAIYAPTTFGSLSAVLADSEFACGPIAIRYPNGTESERVVRAFFPNGDHAFCDVRATYNVAEAPYRIFITYGGLTDRVLMAVELLEKQNLRVGVILLEKLAPCEQIVEKVGRYILGASHIVFAEEGIQNGGVGMVLGGALAERGFLPSGCRYEVAAIDSFAAPTEKCDLFDHLGLSPTKLAERFTKTI